MEHEVKLKYNISLKIQRKKKKKNAEIENVTFNLQK